MKSIRAFVPARFIRTGVLPVMAMISACATTTPRSDTAAQNPPAQSESAPAQGTAEQGAPAQRQSMAAARTTAAPGIGTFNASDKGKGGGVLDPVKLQAVLDQAAASQKSPGMVMAVQIGSAPPWVGVTGFQDEAHTRKMTPDMKFRVGSISKNFVGTAILQMVDEKKISLEDTLEKWLPKVFNNIDGNGITLRQMLSHKSGIESYTEDREWMATVYATPTHNWNAPTELVKLAQDLRDESIKNNRVIQPGSQFAYSNTNFILLGMIAAKADGYTVNDWDKVIENRFFKKLGMNDSRIPAKAQTELGSSNRGYVNFYNFLGVDETGKRNCRYVKPDCTDSDEDFTLQDMSNAWSAGEIISTATDLLTWINAEVKGNLLSEKIRQEQQVFSPTCPPSNAKCSTESVQVGLAMFKQLKYGFIGHRGEIFGFNGTIQYLPEKDLTVVVVTNRTALDGNHVGPVPEDVAAALFPDLDKPSANGVMKRFSLAREAIDHISHIGRPVSLRKR